MDQLMDQLIDVYRTWKMTTNIDVTITAFTLGGPAGGFPERFSTRQKRKWARGSREKPRDREFYHITGGARRRRPCVKSGCVPLGVGEYPPLAPDALEQQVAPDPTLDRPAPAPIVRETPRSPPNFCAKDPAVLMVYERPATRVGDGRQGGKTKEHTSEC